MRSLAGGAARRAPMTQGHLQRASTVPVAARLVRGASVHAGSLH